MSTKKDDELVALLKKAPDDELIFLIVFLHKNRESLKRKRILNMLEYNSYSYMRDYVTEQIYMYKSQNIDFFRENKTIYKFKLKLYRDHLGKIKDNEIILYNLINQLSIKNIVENKKKALLISLSLDIINNQNDILRENIIKMDRLKNKVNCDLKTYINDVNFIKWIGNDIIKDVKLESTNDGKITSESFFNVLNDITPTALKLFKDKFFLINNKSSLIIYLSIKRIEDLDEYNKYIHRVKKAWQQKNYLASKAKDNHIKLNKRTMDNLEKLSSLKGTKKELLLSEIIKRELEKAEEENKAKA
ncbi:hypothetical protein [Acinetobacter pollinis]|uniref:Uncharacterized protein n=1 Tax=Acinetobacter pollinis TaxID=2605270 RepID=A0ABU6DP95_9GAMM|nr:hypothetical protein [Acinetobacter pollinis]MEB5475676.1 hypothetical protein [Acinetobacter pollinis]